MRNILLFLLLGLTACLIASCADDATPQAVASDADSLGLAQFDTLPEMVTTDVSMLVSDSGIIRYHAISPIWYRFRMERSEDFWYFPQGIELQQLDNDLQPAGNILADTAYHYERRQLWHLTGNVRISNVRGERFNTEELFWDARLKTVYSDSFIHIERHRDILEGYGFTSDQTFSQYEIRRTTGIFEMRQQSQTQGYQADFEGEAPDDGEHLVENDEPGTQSPTDDEADFEPAHQLSPRDKAEAARRRRQRLPEPEESHFVF